MSEEQRPGGPAAGEPGDRLRQLLAASVERLAGGDALSTVYAVRRRARWRRVRRTSVAGCLALGLAALITVVSVGGPASSSSGPYAAAAPLRLTGALSSFDGCGDYLAYMKQRASALVGPYGLESSDPYRPGSYAPSVPEALAAGGPAAAPAAPGAASSADTVTHSGTTDQVADADEPDTVKSNGKVVVTLTDGTVRVLATDASLLGTLNLKGDTGGGLLLVGNRAVVLSSTPNAPATYGPHTLAYNGNATPGEQSAQATVVDLSDPHHPRIADTFVFDGSVVAARLVGADVRLVLRSDGPRLPFHTATSPADAAAATAANQALVQASTIADWLPDWQLQRPDGSTTARRPLAACDAVAWPQHATGISTVSVLSLDPQASAPGPATSLVAAGDTVYATATSLVVAGTVPTTNSYIAPMSQPRSGPEPNVPAGPPVPCCVVRTTGEPATTWLYEFTTQGAARPIFLGAGSLPGSLLNSYAIDQAANGDLRVATTVTDSTGSTDSRISVLSLSGHTLTQIGVVSGLGQGQQLRAVRFLGNQAYAVTYRSFDPLYVIDLSNPTRPTVAGQLEQPGYSAFLYPLPGHHLLGVGVEVTDNEGSGLLVSTYDVSDPAHPQRISAAPLSSGFVPSGQSYDPHQFLYWQPDNLAVLCDPDTVAGNQPGSAIAYRITPAGALTQITTLTHDGDSPTRTAIIGNQLWAFTPAGIIVAKLASLTSTSWHPYF